MIENINMGIKIATKDFELLPDIYAKLDIIDYMEIILLPNFSIDDIKTIKKLKIPYAIHFPTSNNEFDLGDINRNSNNLTYINKINQFYDELNPICYILHPESGNIQLSIENIKKLKIKSIALENMPFKSLHGGELLGHDLESLKTFFKEIPGLEFCFDINHAIKTAIYKKIDYIKFIKEFLDFKQPKIFHISGGNLNIDIDEHLHLADGQYNMFKIKKILLELKYPIYLTFETTRNFEKRIKDDLENMKYFIDL